MRQSRFCVVADFLDSGDRPLKDTRPLLLARSRRKYDAVACSTVFMLVCHRRAEAAGVAHLPCQNQLPGYRMWQGTNTNMVSHGSGSERGAVEKVIFACN
jgi:hypothetical protein